MYRKMERSEADKKLVAFAQDQTEHDHYYPECPPLPFEKPHTMSWSCWCEPWPVVIDAEMSKAVWLHKALQ